ncbi:tumor necrosis factor receptor superfamily member 14-like isoform X1 [Pangasianodon hypophthalmus]|uniref:tumor necrosis factor receptor superfamily member 14-like isoform X1 n=1 Tax=Pangasianodon hypophthalmus TaxID=310915 RepID=UPI00230768EC|nr:tumor necrosis factor receptor superfamily member 14-like isoform X1 [Pangasianodon hypophthalmus]
MHVCFMFALCLWFTFCLCLSLCLSSLGSRLLLARRLLHTSSGKMVATYRAVIHHLPYTIPCQTLGCHHVLKHCDSNSGTRCKVCIGSTYTDVPNGLMACLSCTVCDEGNGLRVKRKCLYNSDALCEPLPGYYCIETHGESCRKAREHSTCLPGQHIYQIGTSLMDTVCKDCSEETYSDGSLMHCEPHTNCESLGQITITQGTKSSDAVCSHKPTHLGLIIGILLSSLLLLIVILCVLLWKKKKDLTCCRNRLY